ncbi:precorrin-6Y C5,15-methyltransferase (decarboxylating) subunit CbiT [Methanomicrobium sp. W14]|uniref:precorrin-6Y C5,15-methyltransferase (decarboxylating) subunit CbiT n=1 Tax=Methanomicrobium sp. W14 TaxID=2817839 RepID=UPI001AE98FBA|nr:precorrin-6Y C5,15-methyltransferase (decarboxylating) subunit CbiT [Methanomicrobium sp. W14]
MGLKGGPTQDEVMAVSLFKLDLSESDIIADIGCGTGKVSIAASRICRKVFSIDKREEAVEYAQNEIKKSGQTNIEILHGKATDILENIDYLDSAFLGGSTGIEGILDILSTRVHKKIVVNAVLLGTVEKTVRKMKELGIFSEVVYLQVSRSYELTGDIMLKPINPVYIIVGSVTE